MYEFKTCIEEYKKIEPMICCCDFLRDVTSGADFLKRRDLLFAVYVQKYAQDEDAFFADYVEAHLNLSELGFADA